LTVHSSATSLRDARPEDAPALCAAEQAIVRDYDSLLVSEADELHESAFLERITSLTSGNGKYLVVECASELLAHACLWPMGLRKVSHVLRLDMCVHLGHWRQGHGRALLDSLLTWARTNPNAHKIELLVRSTNAPAVSIYHRCGLVEEGRFASVFAGG
jgi:RimJ/RimL family protein N-acetyltransferase